MKTLVAIVILLAVCLTGCKNKQEENNYTVSKTSYTNAEKNSTNKYIECRYIFYRYNRNDI